MNLEICKESGIVTATVAGVNKSFLPNTEMPVRVGLFQLQTSLEKGVFTDTPELRKDIAGYEYILKNGYCATYTLFREDGGGSPSEFVEELKK